MKSKDVQSKYKNSQDGKLESECLIFAYKLKVYPVPETYYEASEAPPADSGKGQPGQKKH